MMIAQIVIKRSWLRAVILLLVCTAVAVVVLSALQSTHSVNQYRQQFLMEAHRAHSGIDVQKAYNLKDTLPSVKQYDAQLWEKAKGLFMSPRIAHSVISSTDGRTDGSQTIPPTITTTMKEKSNEFTPFITWQELNPEWRVDIMDDSDVESYLDKTVTRLGFNGRSRPQYLSSYEKLPHKILRIDASRYLRIFLDGGLYVDSDTACMRSIAQWPALGERHEDVMDLTPSEIKLERTCVKGAGLKCENRWDAPGLVVAVEMDSYLQLKDWQAEQYGRPLQIGQFAFMARPFHPVLLDAIGTLLLNENHSATPATDYVLDVMDRSGKTYGCAMHVSALTSNFTGPGLFTDAVFRYLAARYATYPSALTKLTKPVRVGDVLLYPVHTFRAGEWTKPWLRLMKHYSHHTWRHADV